MKQRKCKLCKNKFDPVMIIQPTCLDCAGEWIRLQNEKKWKKEKKEIKAKLKTHSDWLNELQVIFNKYIRFRDKNEPCISCRTTKNVRYSAGHFFTVGSYPNLRFNEDNAHRQCWFNCNKSKRGNLNEYRPYLIKKIGQKRFDELEQAKNKTLKLSIPEIKELKIYYKTEIKKLK